jgi:hypothetical protein
VGSPEGTLAIEVLGESQIGHGVLARSRTGSVLGVSGKAEFHTVGAGRIPEGANSVFVSNTDITGRSHVTVTFTSEPRPARLIQVSWIRREPPRGFTIFLTSPPASPIDFTYFIVEPLLFEEACLLTL